MIKRYCKPTKPNITPLSKMNAIHNMEEKHKK